MTNGQTQSRPLPSAPEVTHATESADALLERVLQATNARRFNIEQIQDMADTTARSGLYKMNGAQIFTLMMLCDAEGRHPAEALMIYHIFENKVAMRADAMHAKFQRAGGRIQWVRDDYDECSAYFSHPVHCPKPELISWTWEEALHAELDTKTNWQKYRRPMMRARPITTGVRRFCPA